ncbi:hypothetical protein ACFQUU_08600 [Herbaspirillum sp. GCM10030257]|uniref:hypothetical protein n=1 Tax=Herbaspirillum sp. GCM10030257 TaxID=3273393 RepID=UPI00360C5F75
MNQNTQNIAAEIDAEIELSSFAENLAHLNSLILQLRREYLSEKLNDKRVGVLVNELMGLQESLDKQSKRVIQISGADSPSILYLRKLLLKIDELGDLGQEKIRSLEQQKAELEQNYHRQMRELDEQEKEIETRKNAVLQWLNEGQNAKKLEEFRNGRTLSVEDIESFIKQADTPPPPPVDNNASTKDDEEMEKRVSKLEELAHEARERLIKIETRLEGMDARMATRTDLSEMRVEVHKMDSSIKTWFIATMVGLIFGFVGLFFTMTNFVKSSAPTPSQTEQGAKQIQPSPSSPPTK